jgi:hypothetical protein
MATPQTLLDQQLGDVIATCGQPPLSGALQVNFSDGCATAVISSFGGFDYTPFLTCLEQALGGPRFACAIALDCASHRFGMSP